MANLYELTSDWLQFQKLLEDPDSNEEAIEEVMALLNDELEKKADGYARIIKGFESDIEGFKTEEKRMNEQRKRLESAVDRLRNNLKKSMEITGKTDFKTDLFKFKVVNNGGALPVIVDVPVEELEDEFVIVTEKPDLKAIAAYIEETGDITKFHFGERGTRLKID